MYTCRACIMKVGLIEILERESPSSNPPVGLMVFLGGAEFVIPDYISASGIKNAWTLRMREDSNA